MKRFSDETVICRCTGVTCGEIKKVFSPEKTLQQIIDETGAGAFCRQCVFDVSEYIDILKSQQNFHLRLLSKAELQTVYYEQMQEDFDIRELKAWEVIAGFYDAGTCFAKGLFKGETMAAYAVFFTAGSPYLLLDYFAVCKNVRGNGIGSAFLKLIREEKLCGGLILEVENGSNARVKEEFEICARRLRFYYANGAISTPYACELYGVQLNVLYLPICSTPEMPTVRNTLNDIYIHMYGQAYGKDVFLKDIE